MTDAANSDDFDTKVLGSTQPVLLKVGATWCGPCGIMNPILDELSQELTNVKIVNVDVDESRDVALDLGVEGVPTFFAIDNGQIVGEPLVGALPKDELMDWFNQALASSTDS